MQQVAKLLPTFLSLDVRFSNALIPWIKGRILVWNSTCAYTFAQSYISRISLKSGEAAEIAAERVNTICTRKLLVKIINSWLQLLKL